MHYLRLHLRYSEITCDWHVWFYLQCDHWLSSNTSIYIMHHIMHSVYEVIFGSLCTVERYKRQYLESWTLWWQLAIQRQAYEAIDNQGWLFQTSSRFWHWVDTICVPWGVCHSINVVELIQLLVSICIESMDHHGSMSMSWNICVNAKWWCVWNVNPFMIHWLVTALILHKCTHTPMSIISFATELEEHSWTTVVHTTIPLYISDLCIYFVPSLTDITHTHDSNMWCP